MSERPSYIPAYLHLYAQTHEVIMRQTDAPEKYEPLGEPIRKAPDPIPPKPRTWSPTSHHGYEKSNEGEVRKVGP